MSDNGSEFSGSIESIGLSASTLNHYGKLNFGDFIEIENSYQRFLSTTERYNSIPFPDGYEEFLLNKNSCRFFFSSSLKVVVEMENWLKSISPGTFSGPSFQKAKSAFSKWTTARLDNERKFYALTALQACEVNSPKPNLILHLYISILYALEQQIFSPDVALSHIEQAISILLESQSEDKNYKNWFYSLQSVKAIVLVEKRDLKEAIEVLQPLLNYKKNPVSAEYLTSMVFSGMGKVNDAYPLLENVYDFDKERLKQALDNNNLTLFTFVFDNAVIYEVFREGMFSHLIPKIKALTELSKTKDVSYMADLTLWLGNLRMQMEGERTDDKFNNNINFLEKLCDRYGGSKSTLIAFMGENILMKFFGSIEDLKTLYQSRIKSEIAAKLTVYDRYIADEEGKLDDMGDEIKMSKDFLGDKLKIAIENTNSKTEASIKELEHKLDKLMNSPDSTVAKRFQQMMMYSSVASFGSVFIITILSALVSPDNSDSGGVPGSLQAGMIVGGLVFIIGIVYSLTSSFGKYYEFTRKKDALNKKIEQIKKQRDKEIEVMKSKNELECISLDGSKSERIETTKRRIQATRDERNLREEEYKQNAEEVYQTFLAKLEHIYDTH